MNWQRWFAWYPVECGTQWVWLRYIWWRRHGEIVPNWPYRGDLTDWIEYRLQREKPND